MMVDGRIRVGDEIIIVQFSDVYGTPAQEIAELQASMDRMESLRWMPEPKPKGWWWRKYKNWRIFHGKKL